MRQHVRRHVGSISAAVLFAIIGCHSDPFAVASNTVGPASAGANVQLTFNSDQDYWPVLSEDGSAVLYTFIDASQSSLVQHSHRCMAAMPIAGGTRSWQWCDDRAALGDSVSSFSGFAMGGDGRLLYVEATSSRTFPFVPVHTVLWLADTTHPFRRQQLASLPVTVGDSAISWLADIAWTGPTDFIALGQHFLPAAHCTGTPANMVCPTLDSVFIGGLIVRGRIAAGTASFTAVPGTAGATSYSLASGGATIVFTTRNSAKLWSVPSAGGAPSSVAVVTPEQGVQLLGVSCRDALCVVAVAPITPWASVDPGPAVDIATINLGMAELFQVSLASGSSTLIATNSQRLFSSPLLLPSLHDVIVESSLSMGHLQSFSNPAADLRLLKGIVQ